MYAKFFGLSENPFGLPPDPRYLYMSRRHEEALAHLLYGVTQGGGFGVLTGEVGTGKTLMIRAMLERLPDNVDVALVLYPMLGVREFVALICDELRVSYPRETDSLKVLIDALNGFLLDNHGRGRRTVLVIDEAHKLSHEVLEQVRLLTNLETTKEKLLQILLIGQPELDALLAQPQLRQLAQRVTARYALKALLPNETRDYVQHRLRVAGREAPLFSRRALAAVHRRSGGVPRLTNVICDRALLGAYGQGAAEVSAAMVRRATVEVGHAPAARSLRPALLATGALVALLGVWQFAPALMTRVAPPPPEPAVAVTPSSLATRLADHAASTDTQSSLRALFAQWRLDYAAYAGETGCMRAAQAGLRCLLTTGNWNGLRQQNRPAILELRDATGGTHHVPVVSLDDEHVTLALGGQSASFARAEVERHWYGRYLLLWKPPLGDTPTLRRGMHTPAVLWVREALARAQLMTADAAASNEFDAALESAVAAFQRRHQLPVDGVVGELTWLQLSHYDASADAPRLSAAEGG